MREPRPPSPAPDAQTLEGWEQIAQYLGVQPRAAQRWENELGLPIHRDTRLRKARVFACKPELDAWKEQRHVGPAPAPPQREEPPRSTRQLRPYLFWGGLCLVLATLGFIGFLRSFHSNAQPEALRLGRLLARSTSEGASPRRIKLSHRPSYLSLSPGGDKLFAAEAYRRALSVVNTAQHSVHVLALPESAGPMAVSSGGKLYIGSHVEGIMVVGIAQERISEIIPTGGPVFDIAITPDGEKLFLAMSQAGLRRLSIRTGKMVQVSDRVCPENLAMDSQGKRLYVAYQCSGPQGKPGHDSVEIFDVEREVSLGIVSGPPMVSGKPSVSPDGRLVLLDGTDACANPAYDHQGCETVPSRVFHLFRTGDRRIVRSLFYPHPRTGSPRFLDDARFVVLGNSISVVDAARYATLETLDLGAEGATEVVFAPDRRRAYLACWPSATILVFEPGGDMCIPVHTGLALHYAGDGSLEDSTGQAALKPQGGVRFAPGRIGQSMSLDGASFMWTPGTGHFQYEAHDSSLTLYASFAAVDREMVLVDWTGQNPQRGFRLLKAADNRFVFQSWPGGALLKSMTEARPDEWYHLAITRTDQDVALYVNGKAEARGGPSPRSDKPLDTPVFFGAARPGRPSFSGRLDEVAFYVRGLTAAEIKSAYQLLDSGTCKPSAETR